MKSFLTKILFELNSRPQLRSRIQSTQLVRQGRIFFQSRNLDDQLKLKFPQVCYFMHMLRYMYTKWGVNQRCPVPRSPWLNFIELLSTTICLAWNFFLDKNRITNKTSICCILLVTGIQLMFAESWKSSGIFVGNPVFMEAVMSCKQMFVLSSSRNWAQVATLLLHSSTLRVMPNP